MADTVIELLPAKDGSWHWRKRANDRTTKKSDSFDTRDEAFEDALIERETEAIVLLRLDGSVYGEMYHAASSGGTPQRVDLLAASTRESAVNLDG